MKKLLLIINPKSGKAKAKNHFFNLVNKFDENGYRVSTAFTRYCGHGIQIAKEASLSGNYDRIVCVGGDGTLNETVNGVLSGNREVELGYIPMGSTNDFAASINIEGGTESAVDKILKGTPAPLDAGLFNGRFFTYIATFGAFTSTSYNTPQSLKNILGHMAYVLGGIKDLAAIQPRRLNLRTNGMDYSGEYIFGAVCNSTSVGGIVKLDAKTVDMSDGLFEVILVRQPKNIVDLNDIIWRCLSSDFSGGMFEFFKASELTIDMFENVTWSVDGERVEGTERISIKNIHNALNFIR